MPLKKRISLASAIAVAVVMALALFACYWAVRDSMIGQIDRELTAEGALFIDKYEIGVTPPGLAAAAGGNAPYLQQILPSGEIVQSNLNLPQVHIAQEVASGTHRAYLTDVRVRGPRGQIAHLRMYTFQVESPQAGMPAVAFQFARPLFDVDNVLARLRLFLTLVFCIGIGMAAILGRMAARRVLRPLAEVSDTAQRIGETDDLSRRLVVHTDDEVGQLAQRFNTMLARLSESRLAVDESARAQRQLVADASHELRTPVTSLRTNIEVLLAGLALSEEERQQLLKDVVEQTDELASLVNDLIEVARGDLPAESLEDTRLDRVVEESLARARRNSPGTEFHATLAPVAVQGVPERLQRAVNNLLDNAVRHGRGSAVEVVVTPAGVTIRDHGPGIADADLPHVFDRFYRGENSRAVQGSGLGLSIVRQVAALHGGSVAAANASDGGAIFTLALPGEAASEEPRTPP